MRSINFDKYQFMFENNNHASFQKINRLKSVNCSLRYIHRYTRISMYIYGYLQLGNLVIFRQP